MTFSSREKPISENNSFLTPLFTLFVLSRTSNNTTSQNIGGTDAWAVPHLKFWEDRPPSPPLGPRPCPRQPPTKNMYSAASCHPMLCICGKRWHSGKFDAFCSEGHRFGSLSSRHVGTLGKSFTCN